MKRCFRVGSIAIAAGVLLGGCQAGDESGQKGDESGQASVPIRFAEEAAERGIADIGLDGAGVAFNDYDGDGDADIYITNNDSGTLGHEFRNRLWENDGNGYFTDV
ncbi:MAG: VCBS repeat-containing protein, partial [Gammaproteobacteria bacterium]|nr:VCBS repeat-containing protein [Gammaproteobacteria bacterium]